VQSFFKMISNSYRIVAMIGGFCWILLFLFVPETFWDRTPCPKSRGSSTNGSKLSLFRQRIASTVSHYMHPKPKSPRQVDGSGDTPLAKSPTTHPAMEPSQAHRQGSLHVGFAPDGHDSNEETDVNRAFDGHISLLNGSTVALGATPLTKLAIGRF